MWNWYEWDSLESFNTWHEAIKVKLGIPNEQTEAYTTAQEAQGSWIAIVEESEATGLTATDIRPARPDALPA